MNAREYWQDIEEIKTLKARYIRFGDTKQWDDLAKLLTDDFAALFEIAPRFSMDQPQRAEISGRDLFVKTWASALVGVVTMHDVFLPEITLVDAAAANGIWRDARPRENAQMCIRRMGALSRPVCEATGCLDDQGVTRHSSPYARAMALTDSAGRGDAQPGMRMWSIRR